MSSSPQVPAPFVHRYADAGDFPPHQRAFAEVSQRVRSEGLLDRAPRFYWPLIAGLGAGLLACAAASLLLRDSWFQLIVAGALAIVLTQLALIGHEAGHRQVLRSGRANLRLARVLAGIVGLSFEWWDKKHTRHHGNPNRIGKDPDIAPGAISFTSEDAAQARGVPRWIAKRQGWLFFPLLTLEGLNLHVSSLRHVISVRSSAHRKTELALLLGRFAVLFAGAFLLMPQGMAVAFLAIQFAVFGVYMGASFAPNHKGMPVIAPTARLDFFSKQVRTSRNIRGGWWATALMGGLNYQVEHHLFPSMPRPHLARARMLVREHCAVLGIPYTETSLWRSYGIVVRYLNRVGLAARDPFECPVLAQYRGHR
ncbi:acyl-CoA desaturase [Brevibacterium sp. BRM-1]|uniref:fatty acid desaturase family protein n=1 Tax=Brevibacterium sp. BRM-1 TaxID=2999062 RepID=UPI0022814701|nr:acyl-CoA desaturase [Brevibacterium sp. BRM-1]WAL41662.1 acyl-CoA desaturase [Brevibacterium sp. BRM-1]